MRGVLSCVIIILIAFIGPVCLAYDINHLSGLLGHQVVVSPFNIAVFIVGIIGSEIAVPVAVVTWLLVQVGALK